MGQYEEKKKEVSKRYSEYRDAFYKPASGAGDGKRAEHNRVMEQKTRSVAKALREMQAVAPASEQASIADAIAKTENEAGEFGQRADHYERKLNKG
jgi:hypothetical protein